MTFAEFYHDQFTLTQHVETVVLMSRIKEK